MKVNLDQAIQLLRSEDIVAVPTETVYGLAARYDSEKAIHAIYKAKNRPFDHPLIVHIASADWLDKLAINIPNYVFTLVEHFWPGPLTIVLKKQSGVSNIITANQDTVAIRMPDHPMLLELIKKLTVPIVAPSANKFCKTSPTTADHVEKSFDYKIPVLDGGDCKIGIESTIVLATENDYFSVLRSGIISALAIEKILKIPCIINNTSLIKTPGKHVVHYQPKFPIIILKNNLDINKYLNNQSERYYFMIFDGNELSSEHHFIFKMPNNPSDYAKLLYQHWHTSDIFSINKILIQLPPDNPEWAGIRDRILKATI
ncbi:MAG: L-threonylcarbamoyladenylate synthase [Coxiellaceae bacterium]|nr:L-threonylcarbamoyladenylate synthase [Coxiellaceae bacterium]